MILTSRPGTTVRADILVDAIADLRAVLAAIDAKDFAALRQDFVHQCDEMIDYLEVD
jgi:hypothetical protein